MARTMLPMFHTIPFYVSDVAVSRVTCMPSTLYIMPCRLYVVSNVYRVTCVPYRLHAVITACPLHVVSIARCEHTVATVSDDSSYVQQ
eukprot:2835004-Pyramimonas_sp.AAC.1